METLSIRQQISGKKVIIVLQAKLQAVFLNTRYFSWTIYRFNLLSDNFETWSNRRKSIDLYR